MSFKKKPVPTKTSLLILRSSIVSSLIFSACKKQALECIGYTTAYVTEVTGPNTMLVDEEAEFVVKCYLHNGCGKFEKLESSSNEYTVTISLKAKYEGCVCTANLIEGEITYKFKPAQKGVYYLQYVQPNNTYFTDTVTVN